MSIDYFFVAQHFRIYAVKLFIIKNKAIVDLRLCPCCATASLTLYTTLNLSPINTK